MDAILQFLSDLLYLVSINSIEDAPKLLAYFIPFIFAWTIYRKIKKRVYEQSVKKLKELQESGAQPPSLHPIIDYNKCLGCGTCVTACPEGEILGIINEKAFLVSPTACIGHGACKAACPQDAITLVFGTSKRGIDIPLVKPNFETNVPGIFIAGELGGMGLIRNAITQGREAMESIHKKPGIGKGNALDVVIIGAGPAGFSASLYGLQNKLRIVTLEQDSLGGTVAHFPRGKVVMTAPADLPIYGKLTFTEVSKEELIGLWRDVAKKTGIKIHYQERMENITRTEQGYIVETAKARYLTKNILLCIGRRGTPRKLNVTGEELDKVVYNLTDAEQYRGKHVLVVGGGNSALEAATSVAEEPGTTVTLSYRSAVFSRVAEKNRQKLNAMEAKNRINVLMESHVKEIGSTSVAIEQNGELIQLQNDAVIICAGGILPTPLLKQLGVEVETKYGTS